MNLSGVIDGIAGIVAAIVPTVAADLRYRRVAVESPTGVDELAFMVARGFEVTATDAAYESQVVSLPQPGYIRQDLILRVCYARAAFRSERDRADAMARDVVQLIGALRTAGNWAAVASYITVDERPRRAEVTGDGGQSIGSILELRIVAEWEV